MLSAINRFSQLQWGVNSDPEDGPFSCPECNADLVFRRGQNIWHFAHRPGESPGCTLRARDDENGPDQISLGTSGAGESELHRYVKFNIWRGLHDHKLCSEARIEWQVGHRQADVYAVLDGTKVAVEIQNSDMDADELRLKITDMTAEGVYTLYLLPHDIPGSGENRSLKWWKQYLHALYYQRLYYWFEGARVYPVHFGRFSYDPIRIGRPWRIQDYYQPRPAYRHIMAVNIGDFGPIKRTDEEMYSRHVGMPQHSFLWMDRLGLWWSEEVRADVAATQWLTS